MGCFFALQRAVAPCLNGCLFPTALFASRLNCRSRGGAEICLVSKRMFIPDGTQDRILSMEEKPVQPKSHWCCPPFYVYTREDAKKVKDAIEQKKCGTDAPGSFIAWLCTVTDVHAILIMDNMKSHHAKAVKNLLDSSGIRYIYLPPYSPDLNPIEKLWSKVKALLRKFKARTLDALPNAIQNAFHSVTVSDCSGWFRFCGYAL